MAGAAAMPLSTQTVQDFRTAAELSSYEPAQLRRTIEEQEARIQAQDDIIEQQLKAIEKLEEKLDRIKQINAPSAHTDGIQLLAEISDLKERNKRLEDAQNRLEESFENLFQTQMDFLQMALETLEKLSASPEVKSLYARANKQARAIERARDVGQASAINALRQMADLLKEVTLFLINRPLLTFVRSDSYRGEILLAALNRDQKAISTPEAIRILGENEDKSIDATQALRAMRWAANYHPDRARFQQRGARRKSWLCRINSNEADK